MGGKKVGEQEWNKDERDLVRDDGTRVKGTLVRDDGTKVKRTW